MNKLAGFVCEERLTFGPWQALERMLARLLEHSGFDDVMVVGGAGDSGADIVGYFKGKRWVVQVKYRQNGGIDSGALREVIRALTIYKADVAVAATNQWFSQSAYNYWEEIRLSNLNLLLWDGS